MNKVFHEVLLDTCSDLTSHCWPQEGKKRKKDGLKSSQTDGKRSKPQRKDTPEVQFCQGSFTLGRMALCHVELLLLFIIIMHNRSNMYMCVWLFRLFSPEKAPYLQILSL